MKILLIYPQYPDTFWSFKHAVKFINKKAAFPPLGLLTIASMLPAAWQKKLVDMNVNSLSDQTIKWADYVFISAMAVQKTSAVEVISRAKNLGKRVVVGGPLFTTEPECFPEADHLILNEAEITLPLFLADLAKGNPQRIYASEKHPSITGTPIPMWSLIKMGKYSAMSLQYSRGCPFNCEFCDITFLDGHIPRTKDKQQVMAELDNLYDRGWRGPVFIVDDNFIGNKKKLKAETLPAMIEWQKRKNYPFTYFTEVSINLADDAQLMDLMVKAGFAKVFIGIETPNEASLSECSKNQNTGRDLAACVKTIQNAGFEVMGGFIVGFDNDPATIFKSQINFIQKTGIVTAMVGLLNAPRGTRLYQRLKKENRLLTENFTGDNMDSLNFEPRMPRETLINGYQNVINTIYSHKNYYARIKVCMREYKPKAKAGLSQIQIHHFFGFVNTMWWLGIWEKGRTHYWRHFIPTLLTKPHKVPMFVTLAAYGYHFRKVIRKYGGRVPVKENI